MSNQREHAIEKSILGCLLGTAVGDALGLPYEGLSRRRGERLFGPPDRFHFLLGHGMVSDDTEHTCMAAQSLVVSAGDEQRFINAMASRLRCWIVMLPAGVGMATARAGIKLLLGFSPYNSGVYSAGNGPAMRSAILGAYFADLRELQKFVTLNTRITHTDPKAEFGALSVAVAAHLASQDRTVDANQFVGVIQELLKDRVEADEYFQLLEKVAQSIARKAATAEFAKQMGLEKQVGGYAYESVPVTLHCWLSHQNDFRTAITTIIQCGGDADTNAAIVGGIVGTRVGKEGIPEEWRNGICEWPMTLRRMTQLASQLREVKSSGTPQRPVSANWIGVLLRNLFFLLVVLFHGFRRLLPPN